MANTTFKKIELVGTSPNSVSEAISNAVEKASETVRDMKWFEVVEQRGRITDGQAVEFQVTIRVGFQVE
jgi:flavin-binding protein dodecin